MSHCFKVAWLYYDFPWLITFKFSINFKTSSSCNKFPSIISLLAVPNQAKLTEALIFFRKVKVTGWFNIETHGLYGFCSHLKTLFYYRLIQEYQHSIDFFDWVATNSVIAVGVLVRTWSKLLSLNKGHKHILCLINYTAVEHLILKNANSNVFQSSFESFWHEKID